MNTNMNKVIAKLQYEHVRLGNTEWQVRESLDMLIDIQEGDSPSDTQVTEMYSSLDKLEGELKQILEICNDIRYLGI